MLDGYHEGIKWGRCKENGVWLGTKPRYRFMFRKHDALYIAAGRLRVRIMKPSAMQRKTPAARQVRWGIDYIRRTYGDPT